LKEVSKRNTKSNFFIFRALPDLDTGFLNVHLNLWEANSYEALWEDGDFCHELSFTFFSDTRLRLQDKPLQELRMILGFTVFNSSYL